MAGEKRDRADEGWTPEEKGQGAGQVRQDAGEAGEAKPKGRPTDERAATESAATRTEQGNSPARKG